MKTKSYLDQFYTIDPEAGDYFIEIAIRDYDDIFNNWDSSVYNLRDLDSSLKSFLEDCSQDIALNKSVVLRFNIEDEKKEPNLEKTIVQGIRNYFDYNYHIMKKKLSDRWRKTLSYVLISVLFTTVSLYFKTSMQSEVVDQIILQGLTVGGWVFLWEAFSMLFIQSSDLLKKRKQYRRLLAAPIKFRYKEK
ncbi:hypothetical protein ACTWQL_16005 [Pseudalkalibacillus sp. R45]|uniref:hypothetical protein n=1 Tax=Pseudalkalibacillus sp. R45 TaxID=3457433 RepID=UPI003FCDEEF9